MTRQEHVLMIGLFAKHLQIIETLTTLLESRGVLDKDDLAAFEDLTKSDLHVTQDLVSRAESIYHTFSEPLGVHVPRT